MTFLFGLALRYIMYEYFNINVTQKDHNFSLLGNSFLACLFMVRHIIKLSIDIKLDESAMLFINIDSPGEVPSKQPDTPSGKKGKLTESSKGESSAKKIKLSSGNDSNDTKSISEVSEFSDSSNFEGGEEHEYLPHHFFEGEPQTNEGYICDNPEPVYTTPTHPVATPSLQEFMLTWENSNRNDPAIPELARLYDETRVKSAIYSIFKERCDNLKQEQPEMEDSIIDMAYNELQKIDALYQAMQDIMTDIEERCHGNIPEPKEASDRSFSEF